MIISRAERNRTIAIITLIITIIQVTIIIIPELAEIIIITVIAKEDQTFSWLINT